MTSYPTHVQYSAKASSHLHFFIIDAVKHPQIYIKQTTVLSKLSGDVFKQEQFSRLLGEQFFEAVLFSVEMIPHFLHND